ncbi:MAG: manganese efflux pump MntP family protein [Candidatus Saccharimonadales bacterium]
MNLQHILFLAAILVPVSIDVFILSAALGLSGLPSHKRRRISLILTAFEALAPAIGVLIGKGLGGLIGGYADYAAAAVIGLTGLFILLPGKEKKKEERQNTLLKRSEGLSIVTLGLSVSLDETAIGLSLGLLHVSLLVVMAYIAVQAFIFSSVGLWLGGRLSARFRDTAERAGGLVLLAVALVFIVIRLTGSAL